MLDSNLNEEFKFVLIKSKDDHKFYLPYKVALKSKKIEEDIKKYKLNHLIKECYEMNLDFDKETLNIVCDYINYKYYNEEILKESLIIKKFDFPIEYSVSVLLCSKLLEI